jgi:phosphatidylglycerol lysyltransferase
VQSFCQEVEQQAALAAALVSRSARRPRSLEHLAYRYGQYYDSYLATDHARETFWSRDGRGAVAFVRAGRYLNVGGGLLAAERHREALLAEVVASADRRGDVLSFYNVTDGDLDLFRDYGFQATKLGEEAAIDLDEWSCRGGSFEWLRRQVNYCRRQGLEVTELIHENLPHETQAELVDVSNAFLAAKPQAGELRFLDGSFDLDALGRRRIFVARSESSRNRPGRTEGFLVCNPYRNGAGWAFEIYRQRPDAVRGTIPFLMHEAIEVLQAENARRVSLCLVPGLRADAASPGDSALVRRGLVLGGRYFNFIFDTAGLYHYKSRFRPRFENRYLCARPMVTLGSAWSLVRLLGVLDLDAGKLSRILFRRLCNRARRSTLAVPTA